MNKRKNREHDEKLTSFGIGDDASLMLESLKNETVDKSLESYKHLLELTYHVTQECEKRRPINNCADNPNCFHHLGGIKQLGNGDDTVQIFDESGDGETQYVQSTILKLHQKDIIRNTKRPNLNTPCGIKNLGATCYMNSVLQTLFMNSQFKSHLFNIVNSYKYDKELLKQHRHQHESSLQNVNNPDNNIESTSTTSTTSTTTSSPPFNMNDILLQDSNSETSTVNNSPTTNNKDYQQDVNFKCNENNNNTTTTAKVPSSPFQDDVVFQLGYLFYQLQSSQRCTIDPTPLVDCLQLPSDLQQDTQEFYNLFIGLLESKLKDDTISNLFKGSFNYVTECLYCKNVTLNNSSFFEITLKTDECKNFNDSLLEYLVKEKLIGSDQITCSKCQTKRDCQRSIEFQQLPTHLNIQLMRYVFDKETYQKKKLHGNYTFPLEIDLAPFITDRAKKHKDEMKLDHTYELTAIMMHKGLSISSGHYITHVKNEITGEWWEFDDEDVKKLTPERIGKDSVGEKRKPREIKDGLVSSTSSYSIIYSKKNREKVEVPNRIENSLLDQLLQVNENQFLNDANQFKEQIEKAVKLYKDRKEDIAAIHNKLEVGHDDDQYYWINVEWLSNWLKGLDPGPIDNTKLLCEHGQLTPNKMEKMKRISSISWDFLYSSYQGDPVLNQNSFCQRCLYAIISGKKEVHNAETSKDQIIKTENLVKNRQEGYLISKHWYKEWSRKVVKQIVKDSSPIEDIKCDHDALTTVKDDIMTISSDTWNYIQTHHSPNVQPIPSTTTPCQTCLKLEKESNDQSNLIKKERIKLKSLITLIKSEKYPQNITNGTFYLITKEWIRKWYKFIYSDKSDDDDSIPPGPLNNDSLICPHDGLVYDFDLNQFDHTFNLEDKNIPFILVQDTIFLLIMEIYELESPNGTPPIKLDKGQLSVEPCQQCHIAKNEQLEHDRYFFKDQSIYIHLITSKDNEKDPKFYIFPSKTRRLYKRIQIWPVNHDYTVSNLKLLICTENGTPTFQQRLYVNDGVLMKDNNTLEHYKITPNQAIVLKESDDMDGFFEDGLSETGFKGTILNQ